MTATATATLSLTAALTTARSEATLTRLGRQWQVNTYDATRRAWWQGHPTTYASARESYTVWVVGRALQLMGWDWGNACYVAENLTGTARQRLATAVGR